MISYALSNCFTPYQVVAWEDARKLVEAVDLNNVRCHELARAVHRMLNIALTEGHHRSKDAIEVHDGKIGGVEHSWLRFTKTGVVIDVYRPGFHPQVLLIDSLMAVDYKYIEMRTDIDPSVITKLCLQMQQ